MNKAREVFSVLTALSTCIFIVFTPLSCNNGFKDKQGVNEVKNLFSNMHL